MTRLINVIVIYMYPVPASTVILYHKTSENITQAFTQFSTHVIEARVTDEPLIAETAIFPICFPRNVFFALK